jgi:plastocyanin
VRRMLATLALVTVGAVTVAGCAGEDDGQGAAAGPATAAPATSATASRAATDGDADDVRIRDFAFSPRRIDAKAGQRVKWEHRDPGVTHTVAADEGAFRSGELEDGDEFSHLFRTAGTYAYRCTIHPDMRGTVKVE